MTYSAPVRRLVDQCPAATIAIRLPAAGESASCQPQNGRGRSLSTSHCEKFGKNLYALQLASAHRHQILSLPPESHLRKGSLDISTLHEPDTSTVLAHIW